MHKQLAMLHIAIVGGTIIEVLDSSRFQILSVTMLQCFQFDRLKCILEVMTVLLEYIECLVTLIHNIYDWVCKT